MVVAGEDVTEEELEGEELESLIKSEPRLWAFINHGLTMEEAG